MNLESTWYYTLSTISQTLAAILGLAAVFLVLRLQSLTKNISEYKDRGLKILKIKDNHLNSYQVYDKILYVLTDLREFIRNYKDVYRKNNFIREDIEILASKYGHLFNDEDFVFDTVDKLDSFVSQKDDVVRMVKLPGVIVSFVIMMSLFCLAFTKQTMNLLTLSIITVWALSGLFLIVRASWKIIDAIKRLE